MLGSLGVAGKALVVLPEYDEALRRASANLQNVRVVLPNGLSLLEVMASDIVIFSREAVAPVARLLLGESSADEEAA